MLASTFFHQLWNKGIDIWAAIVASTVSAGIVAGIATITWRWNKKRDLKHEEAKQRQQHKIEAEFAEQTRRIEARKRYRRLSEQRVTFAEKMAEASDHHEAAAVWNRYMDWLEAEQLNLLKRNLSVYSGHSEMARGLLGLHGSAFLDQRLELAKIIRATELPPDGNG